MFKVQEIRELIRLIDNSSISEFSYENDGATLSIKKQGEGVQQLVTQQVTEQATLAPVVQAAPKVEETDAAKATPEKAESAEVIEDDDSIVEIVSPMVGTFYRKPNPESDSYVELGDTVNEDSIVCIVEAMKLFNEIEAEEAGEIVEILVEDGELVEYGQPLFKVKQK